MIDFIFSMPSSPLKAIFFTRQDGNRESGITFPEHQAGFGFAGGNTVPPCITGEHREHRLCRGQMYRPKSRNFLKPENKLLSRLLFLADEFGNKTKAVITV
jgi:hypothetical protein